MIYICTGHRLSLKIDLLLHNIYTGHRLSLKGTLPNFFFLISDVKGGGDQGHDAIFSMEIELCLPRSQEQH